MSHNRSISIFRHSNQREQEYHIESIGDSPMINELIQPSTVVHHNDYFYMIYLLLLIIFYIYYLRILFQDKTNLFNDNEYYYFDNYQDEIPRLLWFKKGYRLY